MELVKRLMGAGMAKNVKPLVPKFSSTFVRVKRNGWKQKMRIAVSSVILGAAFAFGHPASAQSGLEAELLGNSYAVTGVSLPGFNSTTAIVTFKSGGAYEVQVYNRGITFNYEWWLSGGRLCTSVGGGSCFFMYPQSGTSNYESEHGVSYLRIRY